MVVMAVVKELIMPLSFDEEDWGPEMEAELADAFSGLLMDEDEIAQFIAFLDSTPDGDGQVG